jgi:uncharacterized lipoprotein YddW (UPF0748 family)
VTLQRTNPPQTTKGHVGRAADLPLFSFPFRRAGLACLMLLVLASAAAEAKNARPEFRGVWIVRHDLATPRQVIRAVRDAARLGFNAVLVQVRGRGDALYRSEIVPRSETLDAAGPDFDPLALVIQEARKAGLEVHAWVNVFLTWHPTRRVPVSAGHLVRRHPEWFMASSDGIDMGRLDLADVDLIRRGVEGRYLSPAVAAVRAHLVAVVRELVARYDVDGVHLDYVRFPNRHYDFSRAATAGFRKRYRLDPPPTDPAASRADTAASVRARLWEAWRAQQVTQTVRSLREAVDAVRPWVRLSAAVKPDPGTAYRQFGQDWVRWVNDGLVDFVVPMFYVGTTGEIAAQMVVAKGLVRSGYLYAGLGAYNQAADETLDQVAAARRLGVPGVVIYSYAALAEDGRTRRRLRNGPFADAAQIPEMTWKPKRGQGEAKAR